MTKHRPEIDYLRAIAIISVMGFHFYPKILPSGFRGRYIFVISRFLVFNIILKETENKVISLKILSKTYQDNPSCVGVPYYDCFWGYFYFNTSRLNIFYSVISTIFLVPNIFFWQTGGYFGSSDEMKPLLHVVAGRRTVYLLFPLFFIG